MLAAPNLRSLRAVARFYSACARDEDLSPNMRKAYAKKLREFLKTLPDEDLSTPECWR